MQTIWFDTRPGEIGALKAREVQPDPECAPREWAVLISDGIPDRFRVPESSPVMPGASVRVVGSIRTDCPTCRAAVIHLLSDVNLHGACCAACGFQFYERKVDASS